MVPMADDSWCWAVSGVFAHGGGDPDRRKSGGRILDRWWGRSPGWSRRRRACGGGDIGAWAFGDCQGCSLSDRVGLGSLDDCGGRWAVRRVDISGHGGRSPDWRRNLSGGWLGGGGDDGAGAVSDGDGL